MTKSGTVFQPVPSYLCPWSRDYGYPNQFKTFSKQSQVTKAKKLNQLSLEKLLNSEEQDAIRMGIFRIIEKTYATIKNKEEELSCLFAKRVLNVAPHFPKLWGRIIEALRIILSSAQKARKSFILKGGMRSLHNAAILLEPQIYSKSKNQEIDKTNQVDGVNQIWRVLCNLPLDQSDESNNGLESMSLIPGEHDIWPKPKRSMFGEETRVWDVSVADDGKLSIALVRGFSSHFSINISIRNRNPSIIATAPSFKVGNVILGGEDQGWELHGSFDSKPSQFSDNYGRIGLHLNVADIGNSPLSAVLLSDTHYVPPPKLSSLSSLQHNIDDTWNYFGDDQDLNHDNFKNMEKEESKKFNNDNITTNKLESTKISQNKNQQQQQQNNNGKKYVAKHWGKAKLYRFGSKNEPNFPKEYQVECQDILLCMDIKTNRNKYYSMELHRGVMGNVEKYRIFTHYGRVDDLDRNPRSGRRECRYFKTRDAVIDLYKMIYEEKVSSVKNYKPVNLGFIRVGSPQAKSLRKSGTKIPTSSSFTSRGSSSQSSSPRTDRSNSKDSIEEIQDQDDNNEIELPEPTQEVLDLVNILYKEATSALKHSIAGQITHRGIETPLGVLGNSQVERGSKILDEIEAEINKSSSNEENENTERLTELSGQFYSTIPQRVGRSRTEVKKSIINTESALDEKRELIQLMRDMLNVSNAVYVNGLEMKYRALKCGIQIVPSGSIEDQTVKSMVANSKGDNINIRRIFRIDRPSEAKSFTNEMSNQQLLFHGSRSSNFVGLLSRGLLLPYFAVARGIQRTNYGWLGHGIYFGDSSSTAIKYTDENQRGTRMMLVVRVALGSTFETTKKIPDLVSPPDSYDSVHGVRQSIFQDSEFQDDEYVVYDTCQQKQQYLVEFQLSENKETNEDNSLIDDTWDLSQSQNNSSLNVQNEWNIRSNFNFSNSNKNLITNQIQQHEIQDFHSNNLQEKEEEEKKYPEIKENEIENYNSINSKNELDYHLDELPEESEYESEEQERLVRLSDQQIKKEEQNYRALYAQDRDSPTLDNMHLMLIDVFRRLNHFHYCSETVEERKIPKILNHAKTLGLSGCAIVNRNEFFNRWNEFSQGQLKGLNWNNLFAAGGSVLSCLSAHPKGGEGSDIDLFLYGVSEKEANEKLRHIYNVVSRNMGVAKSDVIRTQHAVTILGQYPFRHIQIVLRIYKSPAEVLLGFDIDACTVGFDGNCVWATPRARRAITKQYNLVDMSRRSLTYELRLWKYSKRGFAVAVPGLDRGSIDPKICNQTPTESQGLARLLAYEYNSSTTGSLQKRRQPLARRALSRAERDQWNSDRAMEYAEIAQLEPSDYSNVQIPWGPQWYTWQILRMLRFHDKAQLYHPNRKRRRHVFVSGIENVINGKPQHENSKTEENENENEKQENNYSWKTKEEEKEDQQVQDALTCPLRWLTDNPGRQLMTGSFHPIDDEEWDAQVYIDEDQRLVQKLCNASFRGDNDSIVQLLRQDVNIDGQDSLRQRTPLFYACCAGHVETVRLLLLSGASPSISDPSSNVSPLHVAATLGNSSLVELLLQQGASSGSKDVWSFTPFHIAAFYGHQEVLKRLVEQSEPEDLRIQDNSSRLALHIAAKLGNSESLSILTNKYREGLKIKDDEGKTPRDVAIDQSLECMRIASHINDSDDEKQINTLDTSFDSSSSSSSCSSINNNNNNNNEEEESNILQERSKVSSYFVSPLHKAAARGKIARVRRLLDEKVFDPDTQDIVYQTPLHYAARFGRPQIVKLLLDSGASVDAITFFGHTPLFYCLNMVAGFSDHGNKELGDAYPPPQRLSAYARVQDILLEAGAAPPDEAPIVAPEFYSMPPLPKDSDPSFVHPFRGTTKPLSAGSRKKKAFKRHARKAAKSSSLFHSPASSTQKSIFSSPQSPTASNRNSPSNNLSLPSTDPPSPGIELPTAQSDEAKLLLLASILHKGRKITEDQKDCIKRLALQGDLRIMNAVRRFENDRIFSVLLDELKDITYRVDLTNRRMF